MPRSLEQRCELRRALLGDGVLGNPLLDQLVDRPEVDQGLGHLHGAGVGADEGHLRDWMAASQTVANGVVSSGQLGFLLLLSAFTGVSNGCPPRGVLNGIAARPEHHAALRARFNYSCWHRSKD